MGAFIILLSETYGLPKSSVALVARVLREAGWLTTGPRGVNAPEMQLLDAARLTLALMTGQPPSKVIQDFEALRSLQTKDSYPSDGLLSEIELAPEHTLEDAVSGLFKIGQNPSLLHNHRDELSTKFRVGPYFSVSVDASTLGARVDVPSGGAAYSDLSAELELEELYPRRWTLELMKRIEELEHRSLGWDSSSIIPGRGMRSIRKITQDEITRVSEVMAGVCETSDSSGRPGGKAR